MSRDGIKPGSKRTAVLVQPALQVDLEERVLEHVLRKGRIAEVTCQVAVQLSFVPVDQFGEDGFRPSSRYRLMSSSSVSGARSFAESDPMALTMLRTAAAESSSCCRERPPYPLHTQPESWPESVRESLL